jgi:hypothetical protein
MLSAKHHLLTALAAELEKLQPGAGARAAFESPKVAAHGDLACTAAMQLAKALKQNPRQLGESLRSALLTTPAFERLKFKAVRTAYTEVSKWLAIFPRLENHVDAAYRGACRFLEVLGFRLGEPTRLPSGMMVRMFWMERG